MAVVMHGLHRGHCARALLWLAIQTTHALRMCGLLNQRTAVVGNQLYFAGGSYTFDNGSSQSLSDELYSLDLTRQIDLSGPIDVNLLRQSQLPVSATTTAGINSPATAQGVFFYNDAILYAYGGTVGNGQTDYEQLWAYNTSVGQWSITTVNGDELNFGNNLDGVQASDPDNRRSYYTGGSAMANNRTNEGLVKFDSSDPAAPMWTFESTVTGTQGPNLYLGDMVYARMGQAGILLAFGGYDTSQRGSQSNSPGYPWDLVEFDDVFVYDIFSGTWYRVRTSGNKPTQRSEFCAGVSSAPDDSSFQITLHGGYHRPEEIGLKAVYVLTIPSFQWIEVTVTNEDPDKGATRYRHKCNMWQDGQMIISGSAEGIVTCNESYPPFKVLDTSTYLWSTQFVPGVEYRVPDVITAIIGGNGQGGAMVTEPKGGWANSALRDIFTKTVPRGKNLKPNSTTVSTPANTNTNNPVPNETATIAGTVSASAVVLIFIVAFTWVFRRSRKRRELNVRARRAEGLKQQKPKVEGAGTIAGIDDPHVALEMNGDWPRRELLGWDSHFELTADQRRLEMEA